MASENDAQEENTNEIDEIKVDEQEADKTNDDVTDVEEPDTHDETQDDSQIPEESANAEDETEPDEPEQPTDDTDNDMKTSSKMSMEMETQKQSSPILSAVKSEIKYERDIDSRDKFACLAKGALGSIIDIRHLGEMGLVCERKVARYANSYKMEANNPFNPGEVDKILKKIIVEALENLTYDADKCSKQAKWASTAIKAKVKKLNFDRYKIICIVTIGEKHSQDVLATCRFLWDAEKDGYATVSLENTYVFGFAQCFGLYYE